MDLEANAEDKHVARSCRSPAVIAFSEEGSSSSTSATLTLFHARVTVLSLSDKGSPTVYVALAVIVMNERACRDVTNNGCQSYRATDLDYGPGGTILSISHSLATSMASTVYTC